MYQVQSLEHRKIYHPAHIQHRLTLVQRLSAFKCDVCEVEDNSQDLSYICTKCPFWMHKSCADAPTSFQFQFHNKHPLKLSFSLPQAYHKFQQYCRLCNKTLPRDIIPGQPLWLYYCANCRYFVHFQCARSRRMLSSAENEVFPDLVHLPASGESSANLLVEEFVKAMTSLNNNNIRKTNRIKHWAHNEHYLQLFTISELMIGTYEGDEFLLLCDGCVKPIRTIGNLFYGCIPCKYFLHKICAELPKKIEHHLWPGKKLLAVKYIRPYKCFPCAICGFLGNGIFFHYSRGNLFHIGCAALPKMIKHEAHHHQLNQVNVYDHACKACGKQYYINYKHGCEECDYYICGRCIMRATTFKHRWDPHPLHLIYEAGMVSNHEHDFNCEFCSEDIDTNFWFYHCSDCDLSLHLYCFDRSSYGYYSTIKFGATNIMIDKLHPHSLIFILEKKFRCCEICEDEQLGEPVLECAAGCKTIFCMRCYDYALV